MSASNLTPTAASLRTFNRVTEALGIDPVDKPRLLNLQEAKYFGYLEMNDPDLDLDTKDRLGIFLMIVELAENLVGDAGAWLRSPNKAPIFGGRPPLELLLAGRIDEIHTTMNYLKGVHGGWA